MKESYGFLVFITLVVSNDILAENLALRVVLLVESDRTSSVAENLSIPIDSTYRTLQNNIFFKT